MQQIQTNCRSDYRFKLPGRDPMRLKRALLALFILFGAPAAVFADPGPIVTYQLEPAAAEIGPDVDVAGLIIRVQNASGTPVPARLKIELNAPEKNLLVSTDFPIVEGTPLINAEANAATGEHRLRYLFPIRGSYQLTVTASSPAGSDAAWAPVTEVFQFELNENPGEVLNLMFLLAGLFVFGGVAGVVLGRSAGAAARE